MDLPKRKRQRLSGYDYSENNAYFITICTQNRQCLFGGIIDNAVVLNSVGEMVAEKLLNISNIDGVAIHNHVIMPNHIHAVTLISHSGTTQGSFPTVSELVQRFKTITTKLYIDGVRDGLYPSFDKKIWQKSFHDHIIRNDEEYQRICQYINTNPAKWADDMYCE